MSQELCEKMKNATRLYELYCTFNQASKISPKARMFGEVLRLGLCIALFQRPLQRHENMLLF